MDAQLNSTKATPYIDEHNCLVWYAGETFYFEITIDLRDINNNTVAFTESDKIRMLVFDKNNCCVDDIVFTEIIDRIVFHMDEERTRRYKRGTYTYKIIYDGAVVKTLALGYKMLVK